MTHQGVPRSLMPTVVMVDAVVDAGPAARRRFHALVVRAYREWEWGTRSPVWLRCSVDRPGVAAPEQ
jgi:hypothetical protein